VASLPQIAPCVDKELEIDLDELLSHLDDLDAEDVVASFSECV
jgi:hypothetical protein